MKETVNITLERFEELKMNENKFKIQEAKIYELLVEIRELKKTNDNYQICDYVKHRSKS